MERTNLSEQNPTTDTKWNNMDAEAPNKDLENASKNTGDIGVMDGEKAETITDLDRLREYINEMRNATDRATKLLDEMKTKDGISIGEATKGDTVRVAPDGTVVASDVDEKQFHQDYGTYGITND